jgi:uncharacterized membrane protein
MKSKIFSTFHKKVTLITFIGLSLWIAGIIITPILANREEIVFQKIASFMYFFYQPVCHQMPERTFWVNGFSLAVCTRCLSFYLGGFFIAGIYLFKDYIHMWRLSVYIILVLPVMLDFIFEKLDFYSNLTGLRIFTGVLLGIALFHLLLGSLSEFKANKSQENIDNVETLEYN